MAKNTICVKTSFVVRVSKYVIEEIYLKKKDNFYFFIKKKFFFKLKSNFFFIRIIRLNNTINL
jgi:hypothetical protein